MDRSEPVPTGLLASPADLPPLVGCAPAAFHDLPDTIYFVRSTPAAPFGFAYPRIANSCADGLTVNHFDYTASDGTVGFARTAQTFGTTQYVRAAALCFSATGDLVWSTQACFQDGAAAPECFGTVTGTGSVYPVLGDAAADVALVGADAFGAGAYDVDVKGDVAYVATDDGVRAYDLADPDGFTLLGQLALPDSTPINDLEVLVAGAKRYAYVSANETVIADVTDPTAMTAVGIVDNSGRDPYSHTLQIARRGGTPYLYLGGQAGIPVYSLASPAAPAYVATIPLSQPGTHDLTVDGETLYVNNEMNGFVAVDVADFTAPVEHDRYAREYYDHASAVGVAAGRRLVIEGGEGLEPDGRGTHLRVYDGDPAAPTYMQLLGEYRTREETGIHNMILRDGFAYVAYYQDGLRVVDLRDPAHPTEVGHYNSWDRSLASGGPFDGAIGVDLADDGSVVLVNYAGSVMRLRPTLPP